MKYKLLKNGDVVGEAVVLSDNLVYYHLWSSIRTTRESTLANLKKKYKMELKL